MSENGVIYYHRTREKARNIVSVLRDMGTTEQMRSELERMGIFFSYPKPKELIKYIIKIGLEGKETILDFFAGSGTDTAGNYGSPLLILGVIEEYQKSIIKKKLKI